MGVGAQEREPEGESIGLVPHLPAIAGLIPRKALAVRYGAHIERPIAILTEVRKAWRGPR